MKLRRGKSPANEPLTCSKCSGRGLLEHKVWKTGKGYVHEGRACKVCGGYGVIPTR